jgi:hypothetical protein
MMPIPPNKRDRSDRSQEQRRDAAAALGGLGDLAQIADGEIVDVAGPDAMPPHQDLGHLSDRGLNLARTCSRNIDLVHIPDQSALQAVGIGRRRIDPIEGDLLLTWRSHAEDLALGGRERDQDKVILILAVGRLPFRRKNADDAQWHALDLDHGSNRTFVRAE